MDDVSLLERIKTIFNLVISEPFFITLFAILLVIFAILIANMKFKSRASKYSILIICTGILVLTIARYGKYILSLNDSIVDKFFRAMYFPNIVVYLAMLIITVLLLLYVLLDNRFSKYVRISSFPFFFIIWFLFILVMDTVKKFNLNFYEVTDLYANTTVMVLVQATMFFFILWCFIVLIDIIARKLAIKMDENNELNENNIESINYNNSFYETNKKVKHIKLSDLKIKGIKLKKNKDDIDDFTDFKY